MKSVKIALVAVLVISGVAASVAFTTSKKLVSKDYYYVIGKATQRIEFGHTSETDLKERSPEADLGATFKNVTSWTLTPQAFTPTSSLTAYIGKINFNEDPTTPGNGGSDGDLTLQEALNAVYSDFLANSGFLSNTVTVGTATITIQPATAAR